jgi:hypothetical protein
VRAHLHFARALAPREESAQTLAPVVTLALALRDAVPPFEVVAAEPAPTLVPAFVLL